MGKGREGYQEKEDWIFDSYGRGIMDAAAAQPGVAGQHLHRRGLGHAGHADQFADGLERGIAELARVLEPGGLLVLCYTCRESMQGRLIGRIRLPEVCANVCFGGPKRNRLFMVASQSLYSVHFNTQGASPG